MTLALYGKSNRRRLLLGIAALVAVMIAMAGGAVLRHETSASATATGGLSPAADGTFTGWTPNPTGAHFSTVNDGCTSGDADWVSTTATTNPRDSYSISLSSVPNGATITDVAVTLCLGRSGSQQSSLKAFARSGGTNTDGVSVANSATSCTAASSDDLNITDVVKTASTAIEIGILKSSTDSGNVRLCSISAVVNYSLPAAPTMTKSVTTGTNPTGGNAFWDISVGNPATVDQDVTITDSGATAAGVTSDPSTGSCTGFACTVKAGKTLVLKVSKATSAAATDADSNVCTDKVVQNSATLTYTASGAAIGGVVTGADIVVPGSASTCRNITITKIRSGGNASAETFAGSLTGTGEKAWSIGTSADSPNQSVVVKVPSGAASTITEALTGAQTTAGWVAEGIMQKSAGQACDAAFSSADNTVPADANAYVFCVYNKFVGVPDLRVTKTDSAGGTVEQGGSFNWVLVISNTGTGPATFTNGQEILKDNSANTGGSGPTYGSATVATSGLQGTGSVTCGTAAPNLTCTATGGGITTVIIPVGATITVTVPVTNAGTGTSLANPRGGSGNTCAVDRLAVVGESDETNNTCADTVIVTPPGPNLVITKSDDTSHAGTSGTTFNWTLAVKNSGTGQARFSNGQTILTDELPSTLTYGSPTKSDGSPGIGGDLSDISCTISTNTLTCKATADSTDINGGEGFSVSIPVTNPPIGTYDNPKSGGTCKVDPAGAIAETNENDNNCNTDEVVVAAPQRPYVTFMKAICSSYKWVSANDLAPNIDDTGGHSDELDVLAGAGDTDPSQIDLAHCTLASGWNFRLYQGDPGRDPALGGIAGPGFTTVGPTDGSGQYKLFVDQTLGGVDLLNEITNTSDGLWVKETTQAAYGFGALRCYTDHLNGDNDEFIKATVDDLKAGKVYCIAFNVGPRNLSIKKDVIGATDNTAFPIKVDGSATSFNIAENNPRHTEIDFTAHSVQEVIATMPSGYAFDHWNLYNGDDVACTAGSPAATGNASSLVAIPAGSTPVTVCFYNNLNTDLTVVKTPGKTDTILGQTPAETFTWTLVVTNSGGQAAFTSGQQILTDTLPAGATYVLNTASPTVSGGSPAGTGGASCAIASSVLTCNAGASGATFGNGSTLTVQLTASPTVAGDLVNAAATCLVDKNNVLPESNENNNSCTSTVHVHDPSPITVVKAASGLAGNTASWTITIDNTGTYAINHSVVIGDTGATYGGAVVTGGHGSSCSPSSFATTCTVKAGDKIVITATRDASSVAATCDGGSISNQASYSIDGGSSQNTASPSIAVPGTPGNCDRVVTICKQITQNNDGVDDSLPALTFGVSGNTKNGTNTVVLGAISEGGASVCGTITVLQKDNLTITEPNLGTGWTLSDITGASTKDTGTRTANVTAGSTSPTVTYINVHTFQTRTINVCKVFETNTDGITDTFTFVAHVAETGTNVTHGPTDVTFTNVAEGQSPCQQVTVAQGATVTVTEPNLPGGWGGSVATYPKVDVGKKPDGSSDSSYWTVRNKETDKTRSINLCKLLNFVDDGVDEGGSFTFNLTWSGNGNTSTTRTVTESTSPTSVCDPVTGLPQGFDITITEADSRPTNWGTDAANFPTNNASGGDGHKVGVVTHGADTPTVTFTNQPALQTRNIYVCKNVLANADGTNDGGAFSFTVQWPTLPSGTNSDTISRTAFENSGIGGAQLTTDCGGALGIKLAIAVPKNKDVTVAEGTSRPATWSTTSNDAAGFPKAKHGTDGSYSAGVLASLTSTANSSDDELDFQNSHAFRSRSIEVCKAVEATDDGIESGGDFVFSIAWNTGHADDLTINVLEGASKCATVDGLPAGYDITVTEKTKPAGWVDFDNTYPKVAVGAVSPVTGSSGVVVAASTSQTVTFTNKPTFQQRDLFICKNVVNNADGLDDGGAFGFTLTWTGGSGVATRTAFEHTAVSPSHVTTDCGGDGGVPLAIKVPKGKNVTVAETSSAWGANNAAGFPKTGLGNPPGSLSTGTSIVSNANAVGDTAYFQNKRADQTRALTICKTVDHNLDGVNDGGAFGFLIKDDAANQFVGGTQTRNAWEDLAQGKVITDCGTPVTILQGKSYTVSESSEPGGWQDDASLGYPKNDAATTNTFVTGASGTVPSGNGDVIVTFKNRTLDRHMDVQICKLVEANNDNVIDGGDFRFKLTQAGAQDQTFTVANNEGQAENCVTKSVLQQVAWTVQELDARPGDANSGLNGSWNGDDAAYPQNSTDPGFKEPTAVMLATDTHVTFVNKTDDRSHTINVCKTVADNADGDTADGGTFHFVVNGGGTPNPSSFDIAVDEGKTVCQKVSVLDGFTQTVTETEPQGWVDAANYPQWAILKSDDSQLSNGSGLTSGTAGVDAAKVLFTNKARPTQSVTFIKALCTAFEDIPSNNASGGVYTPNDMPSGYDEKDLAPESPASGVAVGTTLPAGCTSVAGWTFNLFTLGNVSLGSVTTDTNGKTIALDADQMDALVSGGINVKEQTQAGYSFGALKCYTDHALLDNSENIVLPNAASTATEGVNCVAFNVATGSVSGTKWNDLNGNGKVDGGEPGLNGWTITATRKGGAPVFTTTTGADGTYSFSDLPQGTYDVCETAQAGWTNTAPLCVEVTVGGGSDARNVDFLNFADAHIYNVKLVTNDANDITDFTADITGPESFTSGAFHQHSPAKDTVTTAGNYTSKENGLAGFQYLGTVAGSMFEGAPVCPAPTPNGLSTSGNTQTVTSGANIVFCHYNVEVGTVLLIKNETHQSAGSETWNFTSAVLGNPALTTPANGQTPPALSTAQTTIENVPVRSYSIAETQGHSICVAGSSSADYQTNALAAIDSVPNPDPTANVVGAGNVSFSVQKGKQTTIVFENQGCGTVLATSSLAVKKFADPAGNFTGNAPLHGWLFTVSGTTNLGAPLLRTATTDGSGVAFFADLPDGSYTVTESLQSGWQVVGSKFVIGGNGTQAGTSRAFTIGLEENKEIDFFNQPLVSVSVTKLEVSGTGTHGGQGWLITISGCGHTDTQPTDANGNVTFSNLMPCVYTVSEKVDSKPGFVPVGPTTVSAKATTPGATVRVGFENVKNEVCANCNTIPTPTPTTTTTPPTATPTQPAKPTTKPSDPTPTPTIVDLTRGEKTPGPGITPIAPNTGNGLFGTASGSTNLLLALLGVAALGAGLIVLTAGRRRSR